MTTPVPPTPVKKRDPKRDARKDKPVEPVPEPNLERLEPFDRGRALFQDRDYERALAEFRASLELYRSPNTRLYVGVCLKELSRFAEAVVIVWLPQLQLLEAAQLPQRLAGQDRPGDP